jgi:predicted transporter
MADVAPPADESHDLRTSFEKWIFTLAPLLVILIIAVALAGAMYPGAWGQQVVSRIESLSTTFAALLGLLLGGTGVTMARGYASEKLRISNPAAYVK